MSSYWKNKVVWITGASSGIGEAFAREFASSGASVILSSRSEEKLNTILKELPGDGHRMVTMDVSDESSIQEAIKANDDLVSTTDVLVNNAGISQRALMLDTSRATERSIMETNFFGATSLTKAILPSMIKRGRGTIIVMSSPAGTFGFPLRSSFRFKTRATRVL